MIIRTIIPSVSSSGITIFDVGEENNAATLKRLPNQRFHYIIHFVIKGSGIYTTSSPNFKTNNKIKEGNAFAIYPNDTVFYLSNDNSPLHYLWVGFDGDDAEKLLDYIGFSKKFPVIQISDKCKILNAFDSLFDSWENQDPYLLLSKFYDLVSTFRYNNTSALKNYSLSTNNQLLQRAENIIRLHIDQNLKVSELVKMLHIDRSYFTKIFKQYYNISPHSYINRLRLKHAETLLKTTNNSITEIVNMLNFTDTYSFSKLFKKMFGYSPAEYRKRVLKNNL